MQTLLSMTGKYPRVQQTATWHSLPLTRVVLPGWHVHPSRVLRQSSLRLRQPGSSNGQSGVGHGLVHVEALGQRGRQLSPRLVALDEIRGGAELAEREVAVLILVGQVPHSLEDVWMGRGHESKVDEPTSCLRCRRDACCLWSAVLIIVHIRQPSGYLLELHTQSI